jgi:hypothetical protein
LRFGYKKEQPVIQIFALQKSATAKGFFLTKKFGSRVADFCCQNPRGFWTKIAPEMTKK